jgi:hypothetical protein
MCLRTLYVAGNSVQMFICELFKNAPENREVLSLADEWRGFRYDK